MKPDNWDCCRRLLHSATLNLACIMLGALLSAWPVPADAKVIEPVSAQVLASSSSTIPAPDEPGWKTVRIPDWQSGPTAWYRVEFPLTSIGASQPVMLYLPYLYGGGRIWLNGRQVAAVTENSDSMRVRWERPILVYLPPSVLQEGSNVLHLRLVAAHLPSGLRLAPLAVGSSSELQPRFDRRLFLARTTPLITVFFGIVVGVFMIYVWWHHRREVLYGLFGLGAMLWGLRTSTFVFDALPADIWFLWRAFYHASTGGFVVAMLLFALELGGWTRRSLTWALVIHAAAGPLIYLLGGERVEYWISRYWAASLIPLGLSVVVVSAAAAWLRRSVEAIVMAVGTTLAVVSGVHDYLLAWSSPLLDRIGPGWSGERIFLMHHSANLLLVLMGTLLVRRFIAALQSAEDANRTLESRVAAREAELTRNHQRIEELQRQQIAHAERQRIMQDLHDGLGAQLFSSLLRAERGALDTREAADAFRSSIDEMRVAIEALASDEHDFLTAFGNFRFRWDQRLHDAGLTPCWRIDAPETLPAISPRVTLQILRFVQEALTNVIRHAHARNVQIALGADPQQLEVSVHDDGTGFAAADADRPGVGRGLRNMRARAQGLGGHLHLESGPTGTRVHLTLPISAV